ncbi:MAG: TetR/AcrR family transcriptional regulator [Pseudomonadales bacterium]|nr:TetR/AcrR family transcriptional regulator [Pseudomonadales bacterium]
MPTKKQKNHKIQRRKPKQERALKKYNAVLDACTRVLAEQGFQKTTITELSLESDLPISTIYQYFENKDDIFIAWIERIIDQILSQLVIEKQHFDELQLDSHQLNEYVLVLVNAAFVLINQYKESLSEMFSGISQVLTARLLNTMESKTLAMVNHMFAVQIQQLNNPNLDYALRIISRMILGFLLQTILNDRHTLEVERDSKEVSLLVILYLREKGIINNTK